MEKLNIRNEILNSNHPYWKTLCDRLGVRLKKEKCDKSNRITRSILWSLPEIDVELTLTDFEAKGGFCDCEILGAIYDEDDSCY